MKHKHITTAISKPNRKSWLRFFIAVGGLALALVAAIYSTVSREQGNIAATVLLASFALIAAGVVGLTTVPYLVKRVEVRRPRPRFQYDITPEGMAYLVLTLVIGAAALNTGNNLLFIIVSAMLAAIVVSGIVSAGLLRALDLEIGLPEHVFAGRNVMGRILLLNRRRWAPAFSVCVGPLKGKSRHKSGWHRSVWAWPARNPPEKQWIRVRDWAWGRLPAQSASPEIFCGSVYFSYIARNRSAVAEVELNFLQRGRYAQESIGISTRFPFSFLTRTRPVDLRREIIVYPAVEQTDEFFQVLPLITGEFEMFVRGRGNNLYLIREYTPEDSARHLDWKASAKTGALKVREFTREDERKLRIVFDNPANGAIKKNSYERAIQITASLAWHFSQSDAQLSFAASGYSGSADVYEFLRYLALAQTETQHEFSASALEMLEATDDYNVIVTARPRGSLPTSLWTRSYFIFMEDGNNL